MKYLTYLTTGFYAILLGIIIGWAVMFTNPIDLEVDNPETEEYKKCAGFLVIKFKEEVRDE